MYCPSSKLHYNVVSKGYLFAYRKNRKNMIMRSQPLHIVQYLKELVFVVTNRGYMKNQKLPIYVIILQRKNYT